MFAPRSLVAALGPALAFLLTWGAFEQPAAWGGLVAAAALGVAPAAVAQRWLRVALALAVGIAGLAVVFSASPVGVLPWTDRTWFDELRRTSEDGLRAFEVIALPFDPSQRPAMHVLTQTAVLGFTLAAALAVAARRPLLAAAVVVVGGGWATASLPERHPVAAGALLLAAALWPTVVLRARGRREAAVAAATVGLVGALAVGAASAGVAPDDARLDWRSWSVLGDSATKRGVQFVWDAQYGGITFPSKPTTLLRIRGPRGPRYWRASTLDLFTADRWIENLYPVAIGGPQRTLPADPLLPPAAANTEPLEQTVEVDALDDDHLVAAGQPLRLSSDVLERVFFLSGGVMRARPGLEQGGRYRIWSYAPRPSPRQLLRSKPRYPAAARRYLSLDRTLIPTFGTPGRDATIVGLLDRELNPALAAYLPVWREARRLAAEADSPYEATLAVERWLRSTGGFQYDEHPPIADSTTGPPLVDFVVRSRLGYCQHFAGAMAVMLRLIGVPARVAVGFTSGKWDGKQWIVSDTDAHAWVEAWFAGYGWLPFDPTPGRGSFSASYTLASDSADAVRALGRGELLAVLPEPDRTPVPAAPGPATPAPGDEQRSAWPILLALALIATPLLLLVLTKIVQRRLRYRTRDPRRLASAARSELVDVLRDQGVPVAEGADTQALRQEVERHLGVPAGAFAEAYRRARYGPPAPAVRAASEVRAELRTIKHLLREELALRRRLRGAISLRSLRRA